MKVLFIVMEFIPLNLAGVYRPLRFINGLKKAGIEPIVISISPDENLRKIQSKFDHSLESRLFPGIEWIKIPMDDVTLFYKTRISRILNIYFNVSDNYAKAWDRNFFSALPHIIAKHRPDIIITTCPPFSSAQLVRKVALQYNIPYILDMRDAWSMLSMQPVGTYLHYWYKKKQERKCFDDAAAIITVTPQLKKMFQNSHPKISSDKFELIYNSFEDARDIKNQVLAKPINKKKKINIGYTGAYYYNPDARKLMMKPWWRRKGHRVFNYLPVKEDWMYRSPYFFFRALKGVFEKSPEKKENIIFNHIGEVPLWLKTMIEEMGLTDNVKFHGFLPQAEAKAVQNSFDYLLATSEKVIGTEHYCLPSKLFSYLQSGKPVIGFVTDGIQKDFIINSGMGVVIDPDGEEASAQLEAVLETGLSGIYNLQYINEFDKEIANNQFINLLIKVKGSTYEQD